ncbi:MAG: FAD-binding oxidoreductase [Rhizobiales bacterium]|nr:FAD-binding oxidoreductase [Hyphomicrobiales bacterium]NRB14881.1 FAD-binding oxidoreductase [Hyphomicrobiales bacterium]
MTILPQNDTGCGWLNLLKKRDVSPSLKQNINAKWVVIGAGYTGLCAALSLAEMLPNDEIILLDAEHAGEGASARNSGYLVDSTLNDGHLSDTGLSQYKQKYELNLVAVNFVKSLIKKHNIECDWNECGKYYASSTSDNKAKLDNFMKLLDELGLQNEFFDPKNLAHQLGTDFYKMAVKVFGGAMLQPAALARGLINALPANVSLYENTPVLNISHDKKHHISCQNAQINTENLIIAVNGFMPNIGVKADRAFPLLLTASLTRRLSDAEQKSINNVGEWGVLSANPMGATLRYTADNRLMIRNTVEVSKSLVLSEADLLNRKSQHLKGLKIRFPFLSDDVIDHTWSGITCISANNANIFEQIKPKCWVVGCYNGGGIGLAALFGHQVALAANDKTSDIQRLIAARPQPKWLPPQPFLRWGVGAKLAIDRRKATQEV